MTFFCVVLIYGEKETECNVQSRANSTSSQTAVKQTYKRKGTKAREKKRKKKGERKKKKGR